jgi:hypothetical protein
MNNLVASLSPASQPPRALVRTHLAFLASHLCPVVDDNSLGDIFHKIFFPFLLFSKPRKRTAETVWEIISEVDSGMGKYELLAGCFDIWRAADSQDPVEKMGSLNFAITSKIAGGHYCPLDYSGIVEPRCWQKTYSCLTVTRSTLISFSKNCEIVTPILAFLVIWSCVLCSGSSRGETK